MLGPDTKIYIQFPEDQQPRVLHPATVRMCEASRCTAVADESFLPIEVGLTVTVYFARRRVFVAQPARITGLVHGEPTLGFVLEIDGETSSAECRRCYRVSTSLTEVTCTFAGHPFSPIEDVSLTGLGVVAPTGFVIGERVELELTDLHDHHFRGTAEIRSARRVEGGCRYGLESVPPEEGEDALQRGLSSLSMALQRRQLRRLAGTA